MITVLGWENLGRRSLLITIPRFAAPPGTKCLPVQFPRPPRFRHHHLYGTS